MHSLLNLVTGTSPNRVASVWVNVPGLSTLTPPLSLSLNNKFTGTSLQSATNTFLLYDPCNAGRLNSALWTGCWSWN